MKRALLVAYLLLVGMSCSGGDHVRDLEEKDFGREYQGRVTFWKLNAGWTARTRRLYDFHAVPTIIFYRDGREVARQVGQPDGDDYEGLVQFVEAGLAAQ